MTRETRPKITSSEITPHELFYSRRRFIQMTTGAVAAALMSDRIFAGEKLKTAKSLNYAYSEELTPYLKK